MPPTWPLRLRVTAAVSSTGDSADDGGRSATSSKGTSSGMRLPHRCLGSRSSRRAACGPGRERSEGASGSPRGVGQDGRRAGVRPCRSPRLLPPQLQLPNFHTVPGIKKHFLLFYMRNKIKHRMIKTCKEANA